MRAQIAEGLFEDDDKAYELAGQGDFGVGFKLGGIFLLCSGAESCLAVDAVDAGYGVEKVGGRIAFEA